MLIKDLLERKSPTVSFEIFPPKADYPVDTIYKAIDVLYYLQPDYMSVTYGAGGSSKDNTVDISSYITEKYKIPALAHLSCLTSTREEMDLTLKVLKERGIRNILALRGDYPMNSSAEECQEGDYRYAVDLIRHIRELAGDSVSIGAACYPEKHLEAPDKVSDLRNLKAKVEAGTDFLITQLFFDNDTYYEFKENTEILGIDVPIITGIMPVLNKKQIHRITSLSGCALPRKFLKIMDKYEHQPEALREAGIAYATEQIIDLLSSGVSGVHIYTMNKPETARKIMESICTIRGVLCDEIC